ncbi:MAG: O-antigen ligase family protein [Pseudomonadota bacterium]
MRSPSSQAAPGPDRTPAAEFAALILIVVASSGALYKFGLASIAWAAIYATVLLLSLRDHARVLKAAAACWPLLLFPLYCLLSVLWSVEPLDSLRHAVQYLFTTLIALWIGTRFRPEHIFYATAIALTLCAIASAVGAFSGVIPGFKQGDYAGAERYLVGLYTQKNVFGIAIVFAALALHVTGAHLRRPILMALIAAALLPVLWRTKSTTALLLYAATWLYFPVLGLARRQASAPAVALVGVVTGLGTLIVLIAADINVVNDALAMLGKDATLTGRTVIWDKAADIAFEQPFLGIGYQAFWEAPKYANDVMLIRAAVLESIGGFHNGYLESMVATGVAGVLFYATLLISAVAITVRAALKRAGAVEMGAVFFAVLICSRTATESSVYYQHDIDFILLVSIAVASTMGLMSSAGTAQHA